MPDKFISEARRRRRRWPWIVGILVLLLAGGGIGGYFAFLKKQDNVNNPNAAIDTNAKPKPPKQKPETFKWPIYGFTPDRARFLDAKIRPPFRKLWKFAKGKGLIEFQPILVNRVLYFVRNEGQTYAVDAKTGKLKWERKIASLNASSPAWSKGRLFIATLKPGAIKALNAKTGKVIWKKSLPARAESSPIVLNGIVYFGSEDGRVYALRAKNGKQVWTYRARGAVKAGLAYSNGKLFFGDYAGEVTALRAKNGSKVWSTGTNGASFNRSGHFYATPTVAYGRVYVGNTDSFVYSFVANSGQLAWRHGTGSYVYAAAAVGSVPKLGPTLFIGSYDGNFYALDAKSGNVKWTHRDGGKISGAPTVVGDVVYYSSLGHGTTNGLNVRNGKRLWSYPHGAFNPVISDGKRVYVTTNSNVVGFVPRPAAKKKQGAKPKPAKPAKKKPAPKKKPPAKKKK
jgi:outer membrane protein assembly factor BamB